MLYVVLEILFLCWPKTAIWNLLQAKCTLQKSKSLKASMSRPKHSLQSLRCPSLNQPLPEDDITSFTFVFLHLPLFLHFLPFFPPNLLAFIEYLLLCFLSKLYFPLSFSCSHSPLSLSMSCPLSSVFPLFILLPLTQHMEI